MSEKKPKKWIKAATENAHGQFKAKAEKAGESTQAYAREEEHAPGKLGKQARLAESLMSMHKAHNKSSVSSKKIRHSMYGKEEE